MRLYVHLLQTYSMHIANNCIVSDMIKAMYKKIISVSLSLLYFALVSKHNTFYQRKSPIILAHFLTSP